jgi:hypothetical protein
VSDRDERMVWVPQSRSLPTAARKGICGELDLSWNKNSWQGPRCMGMGYLGLGREAWYRSTIDEISDGAKSGERVC